tara:strand:+ start:206 stop:895 length:690 start_codon:yes stop_codon:yes gene_type:complete
MEEAMREVVLVVVAHSDDESISMAGTISKHIKKGDKVFVISMTNGVGARDDANLNKINQRKNASVTASKVLGFEWGDCYDFTDNGMDSYPLIEIIKAVEKAKYKYRPTLVYTHSGADLNVDHRVVSNSVLTAFRPQPNELCKEIRLFEVASATDYGNSSITGSFSPNLFIDISNEWPVKVKALEEYLQEMCEYPHSRSIQGIKNLGNLRGNQVGYDFAEAFEVIRKLED